MTWAFQRQIFYLGVLVLFFSIFGFLIIYPSFNKAPTCADFKQNGDETGVDCGGSCLRACIPETDQISLRFARSFLVVPGRYNAVAYLENNNKNLAIPKIKYSFRFADKDNIYLGKREGVTTVPPGRAFVVFERGIEFGSGAPVYTTFQFTEIPNWLNVDETKINQLQLFVSNINLEKETESPHLSLSLKNKSLFNIPNMNVVAILYDEDFNALNVSSTYVDNLGGEEEKILDFTWPLPFGKTVVNREILPIFNIFEVQLK